MSILSSLIYSSKSSIKISTSTCSGSSGNTEHNSQAAPMKNKAQQQASPMSRLKKQQWSRQHEQTDAENSMTRTWQGRQYSQQAVVTRSVPYTSKVRFAAHMCARQDDYLKHGADWNQTAEFLEKKSKRKALVTVGLKPRWIWQHKKVQLIIKKT